ncbi:hypothetical protein B0H16DRAFT_1765016 [Mycena metata]|uniref:Uncharacterized protein n=1 Tax=Mycena metata TaxID=1033252 RepID=A0AAD7I792_9AGAR|nr:hypothetical protein B0H16DRAFT_1765016 [Mycena metata]
MSSVEATTPLPTARGDAADDTAWSKYPPDASLAKAEVPPLSTPRLCLCAGHAAHDHYNPAACRNSAHPSLPCAPPPLQRRSAAYLFSSLNLPGCGRAGRIGLALELEKESAPRGKEDGCGMRYTNGCVRVGAAHSRENARHSGGGGFRYMRACGRVTAHVLGNTLEDNQLARRTDPVVLVEKAQRCSDIRCSRTYTPDLEENHAEQEKCGEWSFVTACRATTGGPAMWDRVEGGEPMGNAQMKTWCKRRTSSLAPLPLPPPSTQSSTETMDSLLYPAVGSTRNPVENDASGRWVSLVSIWEIWAENGMMNAALWKGKRTPPTRTLAGVWLMTETGWPGIWFPFPFADAAAPRQTDNDRVAAPSSANFVRATMSTQQGGLQHRKHGGSLRQNVRPVALETGCEHIGGHNWGT